MGLEAIATATPVAAEGGGGDLSTLGIVVLAALIAAAAVRLCGELWRNYLRVPPLRRMPRPRQAAQRRRLRPRGERVPELRFTGRALGRRRR